MSFTRSNETRKDKKGEFPVLVLSYKDTSIAMFKDDNQDEQCDAYIATYGYMAEHRRQWNLGNKVNWSEDLRVIV